MTVRLRFRCDDDTREVSLERRSISIGRGPFNDVVFSEAGIGRVHGALEIGEDGSVAFRVRAHALPTQLMRDEECHERADGGSERLFELDEGEWLRLGESPAVDVEIVEVSLSQETRWTSLPMPGPDQLDVSPETSEVIYGLSRRLAARPDPETLLESAVILVSHVTGEVVDGVELAIPIERSPWRSDDHSLVSVTMEPPDASDGTAAARVDGDYLRTRDPLPTFSGGVSAIVEELEGLERCVEIDGDQGQRHLVVPMALGEELAGVLDLSFPREASDAALEAAAVAGALLQPLGAVVLGCDRQRRRCGGYREENRYWRERQRRRYLFKDLVAESESMRKVYDRLNGWVESDAPVLMVGEAGCGKRLLARALHHLGPRKDRMLIAINCRELSGDALDFELFGTVENELSGDSEARMGVFELADGGTVVLQEIDQLSLMLQGKIVRMLREGEVRRIGETFARHVDTRVVASTHRDLAALVDAGRFRRRLYMELNERVLKVPPLRDREADILPLARTFLRSFAERYDRDCRRLSEAVCERLRDHHWRGNVRELKAIIEAAVLDSEGETIQVDDLGLQRDT